jgi:Xaa-Pro aminopeptidase
MAPLDTKLIDLALLQSAPGAVDWLNAYHQTVQDTLSPLLDSAHQQWLSNACVPLQNGNAPKQAAGLAP